jgi:hypothetical protein
MSPAAPSTKPSTDGKAPGKTADAPRLSDEQVGEVLRLLRGADSIELKATVPVDDHRAAIQGLPMDPVESQPRQVWFFDTPDLALSKAGIVVRARRRQGGAGDTVVKLRPVEPADLPASLRRQADFNVEVDVLPGGFVCSASFKGRAPGSDVLAAGRGELPLRRLLSRTQREFYTAHAPSGLRLSDLVPLGPTFLLKTRFDVTLARRQVQSMVAEMWFYPDGSRILELSTKCPPPDAFTIGAATRAYLRTQGVALAAVQETKTRTALDYYVRMLGTPAVGEAAGEG